ncbi:hypothetical protein [Lusitaniella coriacea]|uniref:hypothetical protein n=1 Tax=Lusitaniella coriacea TaxID=1983105 RepID=UPI003CE7CE8F
MLKKGKIKPRTFSNTLPKKLSGELATAKRLNVKPFRAGSPEFNKAINEGEKLKWAVTKEGDLLFIPAIKHQEEIAHSVIAKGQPVLAAGEAQVAGSRGQYFVLDITNHSGHYLPDFNSLELGKAAFKLNDLSNGI